MTDRNEREWLEGGSEKWWLEGADDPGWRCECGDLNMAHEAFCYRCGAGPPMYEVVWDLGCWFARDYNTGEKASPVFSDPAKVRAWIREREALYVA